MTSPSPLPIIARLSEWELLGQPLDIGKIHNHNGVSADLANLVVSRDENYEIALDTSSEGSYFAPIWPEDIEGNAFDLSRDSNKRIGEIRRIKNSVDGEFELSGLFEGNRKFLISLHSIGLSRPHKVFGRSGVVSYCGHIDFHEKFPGGFSPSADRLVLFCLNGPSRQVYLPRPTARSQGLVYTRKRTDECDDKPELDSSIYPQESWSRDTAFFQWRGYEVILSRVVQELGPDWCDPITLEIRGIEPNIDAKLEPLLDALGFCFGAPLLPVSIASFDKHYNLVLGRVHNPPSPNARLTCEQWRLSPYLPPTADVLDEGNLEAFVKKFDEKCHVLRLDSVARLVATSYLMPVGERLPVLYAALDALRSAAHNNGNPATYMDKGFFQKAAMPFLTPLKKLIGRSRAGQRVVKNLWNANRMTLNESMLGFFDQLDLETGTVEDQARKQRHRVAHGSGSRGDVVDEFLHHELALQTMVNRVVLRLLGVPNFYTDYSTIGYPSRSIADPLGGRDGDGVVKPHRRVETNVTGE